MSGSLNLLQIIGNMGKDPEMRYTPSGQAVTQFSVATSRSHKDREGNWQEETEWHRVVCWGPLAERTAEYLRKGRKVYVAGRLQTRQWEDQSGAKRYSTEVIADKVMPLDRRPEDQRGDDDSEPRGRSERPGNAPAEVEPTFDDLPF